MKKIGYKWTSVHRLLLKDKLIREILPETLLYNKEVLLDFLGRHTKFILKPSGGTGGKAVVQFTKKENGTFIYHYKHKKIKLDNITQVTNLTQKIEDGCDSRLLIQEVINLATIDNKPFDLRVMLKRNPSGKWINVGSVARVAAPGKFVTNYHQGGNVISVAEAIEQSAIKKNKDLLINEINKFALHITKKLTGSNMKYLWSGLDLGIDTLGNIWFIEANPKPAIKAFYKITQEKNIRL